MLVEDDKSLREIYGVRLLAEGYDIVSAGDGEEALAMAIKERPHLIISDVMMPKISGFDLLDILRSTTETRNIKVIMMTALSSDDQRVRGEQLGADRYLVKSQVGIEDVVRVVHEVLGDSPQSAAPQSPAPVPQAQPAPVAPQPMPVPMPPAPQPQPMPQPEPAPQPQFTPAPPIVAPQPQTSMPSYQSPAPVPQAQPAPVAPQPMPVPMPPAPQPQPMPQPEPAPQAPLPTSAPAANPLPEPPPLTPPAGPSHSRVINPLNNPADKAVDMNDLLDKELAKQTGLDYQGAPTFPTTAEQKADIYDKIDEFQILSAPEPTPAENIPTTPPATFDDDTKPTAPTP